MRYKIKLPIWKRSLLTFKTGLIGELSKIKSILTGDTIAILMQIFDNRSSFKHELSVTAIIKNEAEYIVEWIEFHKLIGVTKFYLFDNESEDDLQNVLKSYILEGTVELFQIRGSGKQLEAYRDAIEYAKNETKWLAILDLDEFLLPLSGNNVISILNEKKRSALLVGWMIFGSNGFIKKPEGLVLENFRLHATNDFIADYKIIVNPRKVIRIINPHFVQMLGKTTDENGKRIWQYPYTYLPQSLPASKQKIRINHYYSKSLEEFQNKAKRGYADKSAKKRSSRNLLSFKDHDQNIEADCSLDVYLPMLKKNIRDRNRENINK